ncbi:hypothetical protein N781_13235 [Pontibacillus halophilus JSM 076056 = DSM 19796]|uniref:Protein required for attachment to host cells n=1 Tax=Pontibacillus halophilus JSM 076056 = DSM 19796 TaxID=1385510 RepID=A0A0A5GNM6_9BACI|nr:VLRF1 family aeRF1-type release factor [Pontibacillus halophilus]KGX92853.1 hypothetical protein N781_13235 [Pontibacillus halophilus JSM 076056 = DSM 19796]
MDLNKELQKLEQVQMPKPERVLTMYLNTDLADPEQQGGEYKIHLKNAMNNFENYLQESGDKDELKNFRALRDDVEKYMQRYEQDLSKSIILFASTDGSIWTALPVQLPVKSEFHWEESPVLDQFKELKKQSPKTGIILVQQQNVKIVEAQLGALEGTKEYELDLDVEDWREKVGPHQANPSMGSGGKSPQKDLFDDKFKAHQHRWYKSLAPTLDKMAKDHGWETIYLVGDKEEAEDIQSHMNKPIHEVVNKNLLQYEEHKVIEEVAL